MGHAPDRRCEPDSRTTSGARHHTATRTIATVDAALPGILADPSSEALWWGAGTADGTQAGTGATRRKDRPCRQVDGEDSSRERSLPTAGHDAGSRSGNLNRDHRHHRQRRSPFRRGRRLRCMAGSSPRGSTPPAASRCCGRFLGGAISTCARLFVQGARSVMQRRGETGTPA